MIRNHVSGINEHPQSVSSIILYTEKGDVKQSSQTKDYFSQFDSRIKSFVSTVAPGDIVLPKDDDSGVYRSSLDGKNPYYGVFNNFSIQAVRESTGEIMKVHQNFGNSWNVFFFGTKPKINSYQGVFIDSIELPYYQEFMVAYEKLLSGGKCIENKTRMLLSCDGKIVDGYMIEISTTKSSDTSLKKDFAFSILIKKEYWVRTNLVATYNSNGTITYTSQYNGLSNVGRLALSDLGVENGI